MAQLLVRKLDEEVVRGLKIRAAENGRSSEEEHRAILQGAIITSKEEKVPFTEFLMNGGPDCEFEELDEVIAERQKDLVPTESIFD